MSSKVTGWVWDQDLVAQRKCVLLWLAERATDNGVCFPGQAEIRRRTGLGEKMVRRHLHWLASDQNDAGQPKLPLITIVERRVSADRNTSNVYVLRVPWARVEDVGRELEELKHVPAETLSAFHGEGVAGDPLPVEDAHENEEGGGRLRPPWESPAGPMGVTGGREEPGHRNNHPNRSSPSGPPQDRHTEPQPQGVSGARVGSGDKPTWALITAFYRGLNTEPKAATITTQRRDQVIARQLVQAGATPDEAEGYAREVAAAASRIAPVDLRSFERERLGWLARRQAREQPSRKFTDRTGLPPSWQTPSSEASSRDDTAPALVVGELPEAAAPLGEDSFRQALADALRRSRP